MTIQQKKSGNEDSQVKFNQLMSKDWTKEFGMISRNLRSLGKKNRVAHMAKKDPVEYFNTHAVGGEQIKQKVQFMLPDITK